MTTFDVLRIVCGAGLAATLAGCDGTKPSIGISDARVVETDHLREVQRDIALRADLVSSDLKLRERAESALKCHVCLERWYGQRRFVAESVSRLWMNPKAGAENDPFLQFLAMERQRIAIAASVSQMNIRLEALKALQGSSGSHPPPNAERAAFTKLAENFVTTARKLGDTAPADSPTDALDRWHQISMWYFIRHLAAHHDMRRSNPTNPARALCEGCQSNSGAVAQISAPSAHDAAPPAGWHYVVLVFEVHVNPGSMPNTAVGVRLRPVSSYASENEGWSDLQEARACAARGDEWAPPKPKPDSGAKALPPKLLITELFPTRVYDLEEAAALDERSANAGVSAESGDASLSASAQRDRHEQRRFLTRTGKQASFADATTGAFGWDFYPSNFQRFDKGLPEALGSVVWGQHPGGMEAYLEAGGRTCVAFALVHSDVEAVIFEVSEVVMDAPPRTVLKMPSKKPLGYVLLPLSKAGPGSPRMDGSTALAP